MKNFIKLLGNLNRTRGAKIPLLAAALAAITGFYFVSCGDAGDDGGGGGSGGGGGGGGGTPPSAVFWAQNASNEQFYQITAERLANNNLCEVWVEKGSGVTQAQATAIANEYRNKIYPKMTSAFSERINFSDGTSYSSTVELAHFIVEDFTGKKNSKLTILLLDIKDDYAEGVNETYLAGYFASRDFFTTADVQDIDPNLRSNERAMLYMDTYPALSKGMGEFYGTIAHELQHLMNFAIGLLLYSNHLRSTPNMDIWINEGLSAAAEWVYSGEYSQQRIDWFRIDPTNLIRQGNNFFVWSNHKDEGAGIYKGSEVLDDYATVYLFFQWLRLQTGNGDIYKKITFSEKADYEAVVEEMSGYSTWPSLLEGWMKANYYKSGSDGYGSDNKLNSEVQIKYAPGGVTSLSLYPGEGVYSVANSYTVPTSAGNVNYLGLASGGPTTSGSFSGALLTYNFNTTVNTYDNNGNLVSGPSSESGTITGAAAPNIVTSGRFLMPDSLRGPYAISMGDMIRRRGGNERNFDFTVMGSSKLFKGFLIE